MGKLQKMKIEALEKAIKELGEELGYTINIWECGIYKQNKGFRVTDYEVDIIKDE